MMSRMELEPSMGWVPAMGRFRPEQIAQQGTWAKVPEDQRIIASMTILHVVPNRFTRTVHVNPLDINADGYTYNEDKDHGRVVPAGRMRY